MTFLATLLSFIPGVLSIIQGWQRQKADVELARVEAAKATGEAAVAAAAQESAGRARTWGVIGASSLLTWLVILLALPIAWFEWKVVVWDTVLQLGTTEPIKGQVADWMNTIIASLFGSSTVLAVAQLWWTTKP